MKQRAKQKRFFLQQQQQAYQAAVQAAEKKTDPDWVMMEKADPLKVAAAIAKKQIRGGKRKSRKPKKKHRRRRTRKRKRKRKQTKRKRKTKRRTRKKRGRGISPSRMAKGAVGALAASEMMKQGSAVVSPQGRAIQRQLRSADCNTIKEQGRQLIKGTHPDLGGDAETFRTVYGTLVHRKNQCKLSRQRGDREQKPERKAGESAKKARQRASRERQAKAEAARKAKQQEERAKAVEAARKAKQQEERAKAKARTQRQQEADARAGQQQSSTKPSVGSELAKLGAIGTAAAVGLGVAHQVFGKKKSNKPAIHRFDFDDGKGVRRFEGPYEGRGRSRIRVVDGSYWREKTPERQDRPSQGPVYSNFLGNVAYHT